MSMMKYVLAVLIAKVQYYVLTHSENISNIYKNISDQDITARWCTYLSSTQQMCTKTRTYSI